tara:strand:+ start:75 stop:236 length:162 start_codon:yes stop_codon:yes gene_type:complete
MYIGVRKMAKKKEDEWKEHQFIYDGYKFIMTYNKKDFNIKHELTGKIITKGEL